METQFLFSVNAACAALDLSRTSLYELMKTKSIRYVMIGTHRRIPREEVERIAREGVAQIKKAASE